MYYRMLAAGLIAAAGFGAYLARPVGDSYMSSVSTGERTRQLVTCQEKIWPFDPAQQALAISNASELIFVGHNRSAFREWWDGTQIEMGFPVMLPIYWMDDNGKSYQYLKTGDSWGGNWENLSGLPEEAQVVRERARRSIRTANSNTVVSSGDLPCFVPPERN